jgi:hypothetical protein
MANVKISQLPSLSTMTDLAQIPVVAGGTTYQITGSNLSSIFQHQCSAGSKIVNGSTEANIGVSGGNANISVGGISNVAVFTQSGVIVSGVLTAPVLTTNNIRSDDSSFVNIEDGVNVTGAVVASGNITSGNISTGIITLTNGAVIKDNAGDSVAFGQSAGGTSQGNSSVALGQNAGATGQGTFAVAIGRNAGQTTQGGSAVAVGVSAGDTSQGTSAVAIGSSAGFTNQSANTVAVGVGAGQSTQGVDAVAIGNAAGSLTQGIAAVAIGTLAGRTFQANNSIIINATGANLDQTTANTFTVAPVRNDVANIGEVVFYNTTSKEVTYGNTIGVAGNITSGNLSAVNLVINNIRSDDSSFVNIEDGVNVTGAIDASGNITGGYILGNGSQLTGVNAVTVDVTDTNGLTTIYYPTFVENRTTAQIARADVNLTYRTDDNLLTVGNVSVTGNIDGGNLRTAGQVSATGNITGGNLAITSNTATITSANYSVGYLNIPQISFAANATAALVDSGKHYYTTSASNLALTLADNSAVSWPVGTALSIVNRGTANVTVAPADGVSLYLAGNATTGNRTVTTYGMATVMNVASNVWMISGTVV